MSRHVYYDSDGNEIDPNASPPPPSPSDPIPLTDRTPSYYHSVHQPIETIEANFPLEQLIGYLRGNIIKYACRLGKKDPAPKDAHKLKQYADWLDIVLSGRYISDSNDPANAKYTDLNKNVDKKEKETT